MASRAQQVGMNGSITLKNNRMPMINGLKINTNDSIEVGLNEFKLNVLIKLYRIFCLNFKPGNVADAKKSNEYVN